MDHLEEIRARIGIEELVGGYVQLKKAGRNLKGLCPFHNEKTPSFVVSPDKGLAWCFGCHQGGDIFKFTQLVENVPFGEALRILAKKANVTIPERLPQVANQRLRCVEINGWAIRFFEDKLQENPAVKDYFIKRGLTEETIKKFRLGYAPDSFSQLSDFLRGKGFASKELVEAGIVGQRSLGDQGIYDRFRNRLMFPILDHQDNVVGFSGRIIGEGEPKYVNSPETPAYNKSLILYALNWAKESIRSTGKAIFMEGYMDVIAAHQAGTTNAVATCGTALTPLQLKLIQRYTKNVSFCFDGDNAGTEATLRAIELAQGSDLTLGVIQVPLGKDPDECIQKDLAAWNHAAENPVGVMDFYFAYAFRKFDKNTLEGKRQILEFLLPLIRSARTEVEQNIHLERLAPELKTDIRLLWNDLRNTRRKKAPVSDAAETVLQRNTYSREEYLLGFVFAHPELYPIVDENRIDTIPVDPKTEGFYNALKLGYTRGSPLDLDRVKASLSEEDREKIGIFSLLVDEQYPDFSYDASEKEVRKLVREINRKNLHEIQKDVEYKIRLSQNPEEKKILFNRYNEVLKLSVKI